MKSLPFTGCLASNPHPLPKKPKPSIYKHGSSGQEESSTAWVLLQEQSILFQHPWSSRGICRFCRIALWWNSNGRKFNLNKNLLVVWLWAVLSPNNGLKSSRAGTSLFMLALVWAGLETKCYLANIFVQ